MTDSRPIPDPTSLTTEQLHREINSLRDLIEQARAADRVLFDTKLAALTQQLEVIESRRVEQKKDTKDAVDAALAAAKDAVKEQTTASERSTTKAETSFTEQLRQQATTFSTAIDGLKDRVGRVESEKTGAGQAYSWIVAIAGLALVVASIVRVK